MLNPLSVNALSLVPLLLLLSACEADPTPDNSEGEVNLLFSVSGFSGPEAVRYDPELDVYFVANFNGDVSGDANGFVSKVSPEGDIVDLQFMTGTLEHAFHAGRGMYIDGATLWVADAFGVHGFSRGSGEHLQFIDLARFEPGFPNDIVKAGDGHLYVTDTGKSILYRVAAGVASIAVETPFAANGIAVNPRGGGLVLAPWSGAEELLEWDPMSGDYANVAMLDGGGNFDGLEFIGDRIVVASQEDESLHIIVDGQDRQRIPLAGRPADIGVDTARRRVIVPYVALDRIDVFQF